jgi:4,5-DOPA dioxygenase extradiol
MWALEPGSTGPALAAWAARQETPSAVLIVSPHWMTRQEPVVMSTAHPKTWHDFGGFPEALYALQYPAPGAPAVAARAQALLNAAGWQAGADDQRPLDHGAWVPMRYLWPQANVPVCQVSLPAQRSPAELMRMGQTLSVLREEGVLILTTGSMTHNLIERDNSDDLSYVHAFAAWVREAVLAGDTARLLDWASQAPEAKRAHPSDEHFLPLFIALGAAQAGGAAEWLSDEIQYGFLAMDAVAWS